MTSYEQFGQLVKILREEKGITQSVLAKKIGWVQPVLSKFENGERKNINLKDIEKICRALSIDGIDQLLPKKYYSKGNITLYEGDAEKTLLYLDKNTVDCVVTSPPYYGLRDYEVDNQIGLEAHPDDYIKKLVRIFRQVKRVLKPTGSLWVNIGDTFWSGKGQAQGVDKKTKHRRFVRPQDRAGEPPLCVPKQRLLIPHRLAIAMQEDGWIVRGDNVWYKLNPIPDPVDDRCAIAHEYVFHFVKQRKYYFDPEAVAIPSGAINGTKPPYSVWPIKLSPSFKNHKAVFPEELVQLPIRATCPVDGIILDPFCGSGTALQVALAEAPGRKAIGIDLSPGALLEARRVLSTLIL